FKTMAGVNIVHVPYKTVAAAITDLVAGQLQVMFTVGPAGLPQIRAGRIRGLAVSTARRSAFAHELPTVAEAGLAGFEVFGWNGRNTSFASASISTRSQAGSRAA